MVDNNENVLVEFDYQNIVLVDPNKIIDSEGKVKERLLKHENLVYYANLECNLFPRTRLSVGNNGYYENKTISIAAINFLKPGNKTFLDNGYLDEITGFNSVQGKGANQIIETRNQIVKSDKPTEYYTTQSVTNNTNNNLLLISDITINTPLNLVPTVTIKMEDIRGRALFEQGENSPYSVFFNYPYPLFYLTVKGYLGKAVRYQLALKTFNARFDTSSGNFKIDCLFMAYKYNVLTSLNMEQIKAVPYMYKTKYTLSPSSNASAQSAQNQVGNLTKDVEIRSTSRGYEKIKEVYSEYKSKGLIPEDFPEITLQELLVRLEVLEKTIVDSFTKADMAPITDGENFKNNLTEYEKDVYFARGVSWFYKYMNTDEFLIDKSSGLKMYTFNKQTIENKKKLTAITELSEGLIPKFNKVLSENKTFGVGGKYKVSNEEFNSEIQNNINFLMFTISSSLDQVDWYETYRQRTGKDPNDIVVAEFSAKTYQNILRSINVNGESITYNWFVFEGPGRFVDSIQVIQNKTNSKLDEIQDKLAKLLSTRLSDPKSGLGFKPTLKNVIAVLLASSEAFLRIMCDIHQTAWNQRRNKYRVGAVLGNDKAAASVDAKQSVTTANGNLIPVYPWPQYFVETNNDKGEKFEIMYPGDPKVISKTKAYLYDVWPEVEFVEEFIKGKTVTIVPSADTKSSTAVANVVNRVSFNSIDFPTTNTFFANKQESKFIYEIWERIFLPANYQRFMRPNAENEILDVLSEAEFINISKSLLQEAPFLIEKLKNYNLNSSNYETFLASISNDGLGESWQKFIRDQFVTNYIQQEVSNDFVIFDNTVISSGYQNVDSQPTNVNKLKNYLKSNVTNSTNFLDTLPYNMDGWFSKNLANGNTAGSIRDTYNTNKVYVLNEDKKMVANFDSKTTSYDNRPISSFNYLNPNIPTQNGLGLSSFYSLRAGDAFAKEQQITEGQVNYINYSGNVSAQQTTSMLNTPMFVNSVLQGVDNWLLGNAYPYVNASYLLLNSLPIATLREKYKSFSNGVTTDLDYIFAVFKKFGAIHKVPYALILKYGSIWHRYKNWVENGVDILDTVWNNFDAAGYYDPVVKDPERTYTLTIPGDTTTTDITLQKVTPVIGGTITELNLGFYPKVIDKFNLFYRGYSLFTGYTNADIQGQLNNSTSGFTLTPISDAVINKNYGYNTSDLTDILSIKPWNCTLIDKNKKTEYIVPSFGSVINQINSECFNNNDKLIINVTSNPAIFNGSVRSFWALPNYGYFNLFEIDKPEPTQHIKTILSGSPDQLAFTLGKYSAYTSNEEMLSVFNKDILDMMENEFLKFSKSMYEYETQQVGDLVTTRVQIDQLYLDPNSVNKNFQLLLKDMMSVNIVSPTATNSSDQTNRLKTEQFIKVNNTIKSFLEFDVVLKYGNPGDYDRRLFDSFATNALIEDKISFNYYVEGSLPRANVTGIPLEVYKSANPESWKALQTYVGFSTEDGVKYTSTGSVITDFFIDMNIEFSPESVKELAPLVKIYATQKKMDPTMNRGKFINLLNQYLADNKKFSDTLLNSVLQKVRFGLPNVDIVPEKPLDTALQGTQTKVELWESFKALNDTWIAGYDYTQTTFLEDVLLLDRGNRNISDEILIDPLRVRNLLTNISPSASVYFYLESLLDIHHFVCMMHPAYVNYYNVQEVQKNNVPKIEGSLEFGNTLFGTYLNVDTRASSPKLVCVYAAEPSKHLENDKNEDNRFKSDSFDLRRSSDNPLTDKLEGKNDWGLSNRVVGFNVDIGIRNQNIFYYFDVSQDSGKQTSESLLQMDRLITQSNGKQTATQNASLWNFYKSRSYQCRVNMLGNAMIQPTMYFNIRHVPMFNGPYYILDVNHSISPGRFETTFTGIRQQVFALPKLESYIQTLTKKLFIELYQQIKEKVNTDSKSNATANSKPNSITTTSTTAAPSKNNTTVTNTGKIDNPQNCSSKLVSAYSKYVGTTPNQTSLSLRQVIDGINYNVLTGDNLDITKMLSFITIYIESFRNNQFYSFNNNFAGVKLNYNWPGNLPKFFTPNYYLCVLSKDGYSYPYADFNDINNVYRLLGAKWGPVSSEVTMDAESLTASWIRRWNKSTMSLSDFDKFKTNKKTEYNNLLYKVTEAMKLATTLGLLTISPEPITINYLGEFDTVQGDDNGYYNLEQNNGKFKVLQIVDLNFDSKNIGISQVRGSTGDIVNFYCNPGSGPKTCTVNDKNPGTYILNVEYYPNGPLNSTKIDLVSQPFTQ